MSRSRLATLTRRLIGSALLLGTVVGVGLGLAFYKSSQQAAAAAAAAAQPEPAEAIEAAVVKLRPYTRTSTAIGTVRALESITLRNELPGTVHQVELETGAVVEAGTLLLELDVSVEQAELAALEAEARLAASMLGRMERALESQGASAADVDRARAEHDMAVANVQRTTALIERKRLRAPFRARTGLVDLHVGQYLEAGTPITTLQGVDEVVHIDFAVTQDIATHLAVGTEVEVVMSADGPPLQAVIVAIDARVDALTRNTMIRAKLAGASPPPQPGASVRVRMPVAAPHEVAVVPVTALRRDPGGDHVFVLEADAQGQLRARSRRVDSGPVLGDEVIVVQGLTAGERVAASGSFKLREGAPVHVIPAAAAGTPARSN